MSITPESLQYQLAHITEDRSLGLKVVYIIALVLAVFSVALRITSRRILRAPLKADDWTIMAALGFMIGLSTTNMLGLFRFGLGKHAVALGAVTVQNFVKNLYAYTLFYNLTILLVKDSILLLYHRIFIVPRFKMVVKISLAFMILYQIATLLVDFMICIPVQGFWDRTIEAKCVDEVPYYITTAAINVFTDVWILLLPVPMIFGLKISLRQKLSLYVIFGLGAIVCVATTFRIVTQHLQDNNDITYSLVPNAYWTNSEVALSFVCACAPTFRPIGLKVGPYLSLSSLRSYGSKGTQGSTTLGDMSHGSKNLGSGRGTGQKSHKAMWSASQESAQTTLVSKPGEPDIGGRVSAWHEEEDRQKGDLERGRVGQREMGIQVRRDIELKETGRWL
ncbi:MAG: hypothetical protein M1817_000386 [Caeruleum heppii]|nr:MAG: hypothetical protein M1817_000386 [Caeruleum heppii]